MYELSLMMAGAPHGFIMFDTKVGTETVQQGLDDVTTFIGERS